MRFKLEANSVAEIGSSLAIESNAFAEAFAFIVPGVPKEQVLSSVNGSVVTVQIEGDCDELSARLLPSKTWVAEIAHELSIEFTLLKGAECFTRWGLEEPQAIEANLLIGGLDAGSIEIDAFAYAGTAVLALVVACMVASVNGVHWRKWIYVSFVVLGALRLCADILFVWHAFNSEYATYGMIGAAIMAAAVISAASICLCARRLLYGVAEHREAAHNYQEPYVQRAHQARSVGALAQPSAPSRFTIHKPHTPPWPSNAIDPNALAPPKTPPRSSTREPRTPPRSSNAIRRQYAIGEVPAAHRTSRSHAAAWCVMIIAPFDIDLLRLLPWTHRPWDGLPTPLVFSTCILLVVVQSLAMLGIKGSMLWWATLQTQSAPSIYVSFAITSATLIVHTVRAIVVVVMQRSLGINKVVKVVHLCDVDVPRTPNPSKPGTPVPAEAFVTPPQRGRAAVRRNVHSVDFSDVFDVLPHTDPGDRRKISNRDETVRRLAVREAATAHMQQARERARMAAAAASDTATSDSSSSDDPQTGIPELKISESTVADLMNDISVDKAHALVAAEVVRHHSVSGKAHAQVAAARKRVRAKTGSPTDGPSTPQDHQRDWVVRTAGEPSPGPGQVDPDAQAQVQAADWLLDMLTKASMAQMSAVPVHQPDDGLETPPGCPARIRRQRVMRARTHGDKVQQRVARARLGSASSADIDKTARSLFGPSRTSTAPEGSTLPSSSLRERIASLDPTTPGIHVTTCTPERDPSPGTVANQRQWLRRASAGAVLESPSSSPRSHRPARASISASSQGVRSDAALHQEDPDDRT